MQTLFVCGVCGKEQTSHPAGSSGSCDHYQGCGFRSGNWRTQQIGEDEFNRKKRWEKAGKYAVAVLIAAFLALTWFTS